MVRVDDSSVVIGKVSWVSAKVLHYLYSSCLEGCKVEVCTKRTSAR